MWVSSIYDNNCMVKVWDMSVEMSYNINNINTVKCLFKLLLKIVKHSKKKLGVCNIMLYFGWELLRAGIASS